MSAGVVLGTRLILSFPIYLRGQSCRLGLQGGKYKVFMMMWC